MTKGFLDYFVYNIENGGLFVFLMALKSRKSSLLLQFSLTSYLRKSSSLLLFFIKSFERGIYRKPLKRLW